MDVSNKIVSLEQNIDTQKQQSRRNCVLVHDFPENKTENTDAVMIFSICKYLNIVLSEENIDRCHGVGKFNPAKTKPRCSEICLL